MTISTALMSGALAMGYAVAGLFFFRFWRETRDVLFGCFAAAFVLLAVGRALLGFVDPPEVLYVLRLIAFLLIIAAIVIKNRQTG